MVFGIRQTVIQREFLEQHYELEVGFWHRGYRIWVLGWEVIKQR